MDQHPPVEPAPIEYRQAPDAPAIVIYGSPEAVHIVCSENAYVPPGHVVLACTYPARRVQIMPNPCDYPNEYYASLQCHENGHLQRRDGRRWEH